ncbi:trace amine-associated receptor 4-like [Megalops cyprinoides]|uniref:trace amine-associated receptor 4-like n=1 Tax=Megalops cyprinoides TaxID=118141 RepID=UPI001864B393|nr:trace amine-associated receptor 4-like [Megalops cyprinoides]
MYMFMVATILMTICGNLLVIISISHFRQLQSPTNLLVLSLACVDCLLGTFVMPYSTVRSVESCWYYGETVCKIHSGFDVTMSIASILHLCLISVDRYLAICKPLLYRSRVTMEKVSGLIGITWLFSFGVMLARVNLVGIEEMLMMHSCVGTCVQIFNKKWGVVAAFVAFFIPGAVMASLYMKIFHVARRHVRVIHGSKARPGALHDKNSNSEHKEKKAAKTLGIVMGVFMLCWLPFFIMLVTNPFLNFSTPSNVADALVWFGYFNSTCNPLIYGFFYPWFRKVFKMIISGRIFDSGSSLLNVYAENN